MSPSLATSRPILCLAVLMMLGPSPPFRAEEKTDVEQSAKTTGEPLVPLKVRVPKPMFGFGPVRIESPNLEGPSTRRRPALVPRNVTNLALGKKVVAGGKDPLCGETPMITDGDKEQDGVVEYGLGVQHVTVDLGEPCEVWAIVVWHYHARPRVYRDVIAQVSEDAEFTTGVQTLFNNDHDNSARLGAGKEKEYIETTKGRQIAVGDKTSVQARYVRLYSNGNNVDRLNHYTEVEVYGRPVKSPRRAPDYES